MTEFYVIWALVGLIDLVVLVQIDRTTLGHVRLVDFLKFAVFSFTPALNLVLLVALFLAWIARDWHAPMSFQDVLDIKLFQVKPSPKPSMRDRMQEQLLEWDASIQLAQQSGMQEQVITNMQKLQQQVADMVKQETHHD